MKIVKGTEIKEVGTKPGQISEKAAKIAIHLYGWAEYAEPPRPSEIGTKTKRNTPPIIPAENPIKLREPEYPSGEAKAPTVETGNPETKSPSEPITEKKTRKAPVKSKSVKK